MVRARNMKIRKKSNYNKKIKILNLRLVDFDDRMKNII